MHYVHWEHMHMAQWFTCTRRINSTCYRWMSVCWQCLLLIEIAYGLCKENCPYTITGSTYCALHMHYAQWVISMKRAYCEYQIERTLYMHIAMSVQIQYAQRFDHIVCVESKYLAWLNVCNLYARCALTKFNYATRINSTYYRWISVCRQFSFFNGIACGLSKTNCPYTEKYYIGSIYCALHMHYAQWVNSMKRVYSEFITGYGSTLYIGIA